jgi:hypothetical protein
MLLVEFENGFRLLKSAYGERVFPPERETLLFKRYEHAQNGLFKSAVETIVLHLFPPNQVLSFLDERLRQSTSKDERAFYAWAEKQPLCLNCSNSGLLLTTYIHPELRSRYERTWRCTCIVGKRLLGYDFIAVWDSRAGEAIKSYSKPHDTAGRPLQRQYMRDVQALKAGMSHELPYDPNERGR